MEKKQKRDRSKLKQKTRSTRKNKMKKILSKKNQSKKGLKLNPKKNVKIKKSTIPFNNLNRKHNKMEVRVTK